MFPKEHSEWVKYRFRATKTIFMSINHRAISFCKINKLNFCWSNREKATNDIINIFTIAEDIENTSVGSRVWFCMKFMSEVKLSCIKRKQIKAYRLIFIFETTIAWLCILSPPEVSCGDVCVLKHPKTQERFFMSRGGAVFHSLNRRCHF